MTPGKPGTSSRKRPASGDNQTNPRKRIKRAHAKPDVTEENGGRKKKAKKSPGEGYPGKYSDTHLGVSERVREGRFWSRAHNVAPYTNGGFELNRIEQVGSLQARTAAHEFLSACDRLRCMVDSNRLSRVLGGGSRTPEWCDLMLRIMHRTTEEFFKINPRKMYDGTKWSSFRKEMTRALRMGTESKRANLLPRADSAKDGTPLQPIASTEEPVPQAPESRKSLSGLALYSDDEDDVEGSGSEAPAVQLPEKSTDVPEDRAVGTGIDVQETELSEKDSEAADATPKKRPYKKRKQPSMELPETACDYPSDTDSEEKKYQLSKIPSTELLQSNCVRRYVQCVTNGASQTLGQYMQLCMSKTPVAFPDWNPGVDPPDTNPPDSDIEWWEKPHFRVSGSNRVKHSASIVRRWQDPLSQKFLSRCALIRTDALLDGLREATFAQAQATREVPPAPVIAMDPQAVHFLATSAGRFAIHVVNIAAHCARLDAFGDGKYSRVITERDINTAMRRVCEHSELGSPVRLFLNGTSPWGHHGTRSSESAWKRPIFTDYESLELCRLVPKSVISFPKVVRKEVDALNNELKLIAQGQQYCSELQDDSSDVCSSFTCDSSEVASIGEYAENFGATPFQVYGLPPRRERVSEGNVSCHIENSSESDSQRVYANRIDNGPLESGEESSAAVNGTALDTSELCRFLKTSLSDHAAHSQGTVCYHRLSWLCLHFLGIKDTDWIVSLDGSIVKRNEVDQVEEEDAESSTLVNCSASLNQGSSLESKQNEKDVPLESDKNNRNYHLEPNQFKQTQTNEESAINAEAGAYAERCNFTDFGSVAIPGCVAMTKEAMDRLVTGLDGFVRSEAAILSACAAHDDGRPWIDRADVVLVCSIRKEQLPPEFI